MNTHAKGLLLLCIALVALLAVSGCSEPEPTACPVPTLPPESTSSMDLAAAPATVTDNSQQPAVQADDGACSGGTLSPSQAYELLGDATLTVMTIDIRTGTEYEKGHVPGAINMPSNDPAFRDHVRVLPRVGTYFIYCRSGSTTRAVLTQMVKDGFVHVCHMGSGFNGWQREGLPVEKGAA